MSSEPEPGPRFQSRTWTLKLRTWTWTRRTSTGTLASESRQETSGGRRNNDTRPLVGISAMSFLQWFGWVARKATCL